MWIIVGLGNPGRTYEGTRHNIGFMVVGEIAGRIRAGFRMSEEYESAEGFIGTEKVVLIKPLTFMNLSGRAVARALRYFRGDVERLMVVHDDLDMEVGRLKLRMGGGAGGHKGIESVIDVMGPDFLRIKIGIGKPESGNTEGYVLGKLVGEAKDVVGDAVVRAADAVETVVLDGRERAMTVFNA